MPGPPQLDASLRAARCGDSRAVGELWLRHRRFVATILLAHGAARELDDLLQEVALRMTRSLGELADAARLRPWLRTIARNVAIDHGRQAAATRPLQALPPLGAEPLFDAPTQEQHRDELEQTLRDLGDLDPTYREPLLLRAVDGLSQREIAIALDLPETTVETRLARARRWLRERRDADFRNEEQTDHEPIRRAVD